MKLGYIAILPAAASIWLGASAQAYVIATDNFDGLSSYPYAVGYGADTPTGGQWLLADPNPNGPGRVAIDNGSLGYDGIPTAQSGTGYGQFSNGNVPFSFTGSLTDTATHTFNVGDTVSVSFYTATRTNAGAAGIPLTVELVPTGGGTPIVIGAVTPTSSTYTLTTTTPFPITTAGSYDVSFVDATGTTGDLTTLLDTVSYSVTPTVLPEPASLGLLGLGSLGLLARRRGHAALARRV